MKKFIVFWFKGGRIGSIELNDSNWKKVNNSFIYNIIQIDDGGTTHINIFGMK